MNVILSSDYVAKAVPSSSTESLDPTMLVLLGAGGAALVFVVALRFVWAIFSGIASFAESLVTGLVRGVFATGGVGLVILVIFVIYVVTVLPNRGGSS